MSHLARVFWEALDRVDYAVMLARCYAVDLIYGPEPPTPADKKREADHERLRKGFPGVGLDGRIVVDHEERHMPTQPTMTTPSTASRRLTEPRS